MGVIPTRRWCRFKQSVAHFVGISALLLCANAFAAERPNIVFMLSDNLGYGDLGSYGGGVIRGAPTPELDKLASQGIRFTNFNVEAECTPSRSALMTGRYALRSGTTRAVPIPGIPQGLAPWEVTTAEVLGDAGYKTAIFGKWHIGASEGRYPTDQGFDVWWGFPNSTDSARFSSTIGFDKSFMPTAYLYEGTAQDGVKPVQEYNLDARPFIDATIADKAVNYIKQQANSDEPFYLFVSWSLVHHPSIPHPDFDGKSGNGRFSDAMMEHDHRVGQVVAALKEAGLDDNTLVIYASDNGPDRAEYPFIGDTGPYRGYLGTVHEGSIRTPMFARWPQKIEAGQVSNELISIHDFLPTFAALTGAKMPTDRAIDGVDQSKLLFANQGASARESVFFFHDQRLMAMKWKQFKIYLHKESPDYDDRRYNELWAPLIYNTMQDPKEANDISSDGNLWMVGALLKEVLPLVGSIERYGLIQPGADERSKAEIEIPFLKHSQMKRSLQELQRKRKAKASKGGAE